METTAFDYRDFFPRWTDKPDSPESWRIENETSYVKDGVEYFVLWSNFDHVLVLFYARVAHQVRISRFYGRDSYCINLTSLTARPPIKRPRPMTVEEVWHKHREGALFRCAGVEGAAMCCLQAISTSQRVRLLSDYWDTKQLEYTLDLGKTWNKCEVVD